MFIDFLRTSDNFLWVLARTLVIVYFSLPPNLRKGELFIMFSFRLMGFRFVCLVVYVLLEILISCIHLARDCVRLSPVFRLLSMFNLNRTSYGGLGFGSRFVCVYGINAGGTA